MLFRSTTCQPSLQGQTPAAALAQLRPLEPQCHKHAPFLYTLGQVLNQAGGYDEAVDRLESALLYRPGHWPTQLEYAIALEGVGDRQSALNLIQTLSSNPEVDTATRQQLQALLRRPTHSSSAPERRGRFSVVSGYDNNLLSSTHHSQFSLTTPDGLLPVQLDQDQRPRAGFFVRTDIGHDGQLAASEAANWRYSLAASYRSNPGFKPANYGQVGVQVERSSNTGHGPYLLGQYQALVRSGTVVLRQAQASTGYDFPLPLLGDCQQRLGFDAQHIGYPTNPVLDGRYLGLSSGTNCPATGLQAQLRLGQDRPIDPTKPGGSQRQLSMRISKRTPLGDAALTLEAEATFQQDQTGYSPLLADNARRNVRRGIFRAEYRWTAGSISPNFSPFIGLEVVEQRSNLRLFEFKNQSITIGFSSRW